MRDDARVIFQASLGLTAALQPGFQNRNLTVHASVTPASLDQPITAEKEGLATTPSSLAHRGGHMNVSNVGLDYDTSCCLRDRCE